MMLSIRTIDTFFGWFINFKKSILQEIKMTGNVALIGAGLAAIGVGIAAIGVGNIFGNFLAGALRNPSAADSQFGRAFIGAALAEGLGIFAFVIGILLALK